MNILPIMRAGLLALVLMTPKSEAAFAMDFSSMVEAASSGVVRVNVTKALGSEALVYAKSAELLRQYYGANLPDIPAVEYAHGTGFFVSRDGYILTNHHVIEGASNITVSLSDRTELDATLVGSDQSSDVAVLKVAGNDFAALPIAKDPLKVGEPVLAIGSPFGFDYSASSGIVSAKSRNFDKEAVVPFIQSDVALNPGNSGGPLFNQKGQVVGVNSRIFSGTGGYMGLSFSIPIDVAMDIYEQIKATGKVVRVHLGITVQDVDRDLAQALKLPRPQGALLTRILPDSPAAKAGLRIGDVVLSFNGEFLNKASDLLNLINKSRPNQAFVLNYSRNGTAGVATGNFEPIATDTESQTRRIALGLRLRSLSLAEAKSLGVKGGVLVTNVEPFGLASRAGVSVGDVLLNLNGQPTPTIKHFANAVEQLPVKGVVTLHLIRQGVPAIIGLRLE